MPLSEHEQRLLEQIEQSLYAEDPKFARSWRSKDLGSVRRAKLVRAALAFLVGLGALLAGVITLNGNAGLGVGLGVGGFVVMLAGSWFALSGRQRRSAPAPASGSTAASTPRRPHGVKQSLRSRLEERWERRQDGR